MPQESPRPSDQDIAEVALSPLGYASRELIPWSITAMLAGPLGLLSAAMAATFVYFNRQIGHGLVEFLLGHSSLSLPVAFRTALVMTVTTVLAPALAGLTLACWSSLRFRQRIMKGREFALAAVLLNLVLLAMLTPRVYLDAADELRPPVAPTVVADADPSADPGEVVVASPR